MLIKSRKNGEGISGFHDLMGFLVHSLVSPVCPCNSGFHGHESDSGPEAGRFATHLPSNKVSQQYPAEDSHVPVEQHVSAVQPSAVHL